MRSRAAFVLLFMFCLFTDGPAWADKRVALVIGNSAYQNVGRLTNPANDASAVAEMFRAARFEVVESKRDLNNTEMRRVLRDFTDKSRDADMAVVYYAGHGIEVDGMNYLIPVDAILDRDSDAYDEAITLDRVLQVIEPARKLRLVILDACRDNPFARTMKRTVASRALGRGLAGVEPGKPNTLIAFAAKGGSTADDGAGSNSPFTTALLKHLTTPGLDLRKAFGLIRDDVIKATGNKQEPFVYGSLGGTDVSLVPAAPVAQAAPSQPAANPQAEVRRDYELALQLNNRQAWEFFIQQYPAGFYANLARVQLDKIAAEEGQRSATDKARQAEAEKARLAAEGAKAAEQARAAREAKAAEDARIAAEKQRQAEQAKAEAAERARAAAERAAAEKQAKEKARSRSQGHPRKSPGRGQGHPREGRGRREGSGRRAEGRGEGSRAPEARGTGAGEIRQTRGQAGAGRGASCGCKQDHADAAGAQSLAADGTAPRRLPDRCRWRRMDRGLAPIAGAVQQPCRHEARSQAREHRCARRGEKQTGAHLPADLRARLPRQWRALREDRLPSGIRGRRRQHLREDRAEQACGEA